MRRVLTCLCVLCLLPFAALAQDNDRGFIQGLLEDALSGEGRTVQLEGFAGALSSQARIDEITVTDAEGIWLTVRDVTMSWNRSALLRGAIDIQEIAIGEIDLARPPVSPDSTPSATARAPFSLPDLPVSVALDQLAIARLALGPDIMGTPVALSVSGAAELAGGEGFAEITLDRLDAAGTFALTGRFDNATRNLAVDLRLQEPQGGLAATLIGLRGAPATELTVQGEGPLSDFAADITLATDGRPRLDGRVTLTADTDEAETTQRFSANLSGDISPLVAPEFAEFLGNSVGLEVEGAQEADGTLRLSTLDLRAQALALAGAAEIAPDGWPRAFDLNVDIEPPSGGSVLLPIPGDPVSVRGADLRAQFDASRGDAWTLTGELRGLSQAAILLDQIGLQGTGVIARRSNEVQGQVTLDATGIAMSDPALGGAVGDALNGALSFDWAAGQPLVISDVDLRGADYGLTGDLVVELGTADASLLLRPDLTIAANDLSRFAVLAGQPLRGAARLALRGDVAPVESAVDVVLQGETRGLGVGIAQLDPLLAGTGQLRATIARDQTGTRIDGLRVATDHAEITGQASLGETTGAADLAADIRELARIVPQISGPGRLDITARRDGPAWDISLDGALPGRTTLALTGRVENFDQVRADLQAGIDNLSAYRRLAGRAIGGSATLTASATGSIKALSGTLDMQLRGQSLSAGIPALAPLLRGRSTLDLQAERRADGTLAIARADLDATGVEADVSGEIAGSGGDLRYALRLPNLGLIVPELGGPAQVTGSASSSGGPWRIDADGTGPGGITLATSGTVTPQGQLDLRANGGAPLAIVNAWLNGQTVAGQAQFDLRVAGPPALSSVSGQVALSGGRFALPAQRIAVENIGGAVRLAGGRADVDIGGQIASGGTLDIRGPVGLSAPYVADLAVTLDDAILRDPELYETNADGTVRIAGPLTGGARIGGDITLDVVELRIPNIGPSYAALEGLEHRNLPQDVRQTLDLAGFLDAPGTRAGPSYPIDLVIRAPSRMFVRGRGLDAELGGQLRLTGTTSNIVPIGQFDLIRGRLDLLGRRLTLTEGAVSLQGSFDPYIRFAAQTEVEATQITIRIEGPATAPEPIISSSPDLPEDEVLSLFLFGRSVEQISPLQAVRLAAALRTLSGQGGLGITDGLRTGLGVDDLSIGTDAEGNATANIGGYVTENLYTDVSVNSEGESQIQLNLDVTRSITVRGRVTSEGETGLGVFFERDY